MQVNKDEWMDAFSVLTRSRFGLYLYCSANMNGYRSALSSQAVQNAPGISNSSYRRAVEAIFYFAYFNIYILFIFFLFHLGNHRRRLKWHHLF